MCLGPDGARNCTGETLNSWQNMVSQVPVSNLSLKALVSPAPGGMHCGGGLGLDQRPLALRMELSGLNLILTLNISGPLICSNGPVTESDKYQWRTFGTELGPDTDSFNLCYDNVTCLLLYKNLIGWKILGINPDARHMYSHMMYSVYLIYTWDGLQNINSLFRLSYFVGLIKLFSFHLGILK